MSRLNEVIRAAIDEYAGIAYEVTSEGREEDERDCQGAADHIEARIVQASGGPTHVVHLEGGAWTIRHPLTERFEGDSLFECLVTVKWPETLERFVSSLGELPPPGDYYAWIEGDGYLSFQDVDSDEDHG